MDGSNKQLSVLKFGGTSVKNATNISKVIDIIRPRANSERMVVVVSALGGVTDLLQEAGNLAASGVSSYKEVFYEIRYRHLDTVMELIGADTRVDVLAGVNTRLYELENLLTGIQMVGELTPRGTAKLLGYGELLSSFIISQALKDNDIDNVWMDSRSLILTDNKFVHGTVDFKQTDARIVQMAAQETKLWMVPGFISSNTKGEQTLLGRGGSDYTAAIISSALKADILEIWTDVSGMMTSDPRVVKRAFTIPRISYNEALELSHFGSKVIYPSTIIPALKSKIPIKVKNTFAPEDEGTLITHNIAEANGDSYVRGVSSYDNISLLTMEGSGMVGVVGIDARLFSALARKEISVMMVTQGSSEHSISLVLSPSDAEEAKLVLEKEFGLEIQMSMVEPIRIEHDVCIIAVVGERMKDTPGISARLFAALARNGISARATAQGASELNISTVIPKKDKVKALNAVHEEFFLSNNKTINLFVVGVGVVGKTLLNQIASQFQNLMDHNAIELRVVGIARSNRFVLDEHGIELEHWPERLEVASAGTIDQFVQQLIDMNLRNSVFVDNTANELITKHYKRLLQASISVVTPNKIANAAPYEQYKELHKAASKYGVQFLYETNVGAGLPIINTLQDMIHSGDKVERIEAILSGSLNFIFSSLSQGKDYLTAVREAKALGYTEPDPRLDLSGTDVARKILILSREVGAELNISDIDIESCIGEECAAATNDAEFWAAVENFDAPRINAQVAEATKAGKRLKYIARFEHGKASTQIAAVGSEHPFYNISGSDNIIAFTTMRYRTNPLIVIGPGAGADVTAAGVFADIIRIINH